VVIPSWLRKQFPHEDGTKGGGSSHAGRLHSSQAVTLGDNIQRLRGMLKNASRRQAFAQEVAEHKRREKALEEAQSMPAAQILDSHALLALLRDSRGRNSSRHHSRKSRPARTIRFTWTRSENYAEVQYTIRRKDGGRRVGRPLPANWSPLRFSFNPVDPAWPTSPPTSKARFKMSPGRRLRRRAGEGEKAPNSSPATRSSRR